MTAHEYQAEEVVADLLLDRPLQLGLDDVAPQLKLAGQLLVLALEPRAAGAGGRSRGAWRWP